MTIDVLLYGASLMLEFVALVALRIKEPTLRRPFRVPGGMLGAIGVGVFPLLLLGLSVFRGEHEQIFGMSGVMFGFLLDRWRYRGIRDQSRRLESVGVMAPVPRHTGKVIQGFPGSTAR